MRNETTNTVLYSKHFYSNDPAYSGWRTVNFGWSNWQIIQWQPVLVDLSNAIGHNVTITITAADCAYGGHGGYAYFDGDENLDSLTRNPQRPPVRGLFSVLMLPLTARCLKQFRG